MKHFYLFATFFFILLFNLVSAQAPAIEWQKSYGGSDQDIASSIQATAEGGYILAGYSISADGDVNGNHGNYDFWVVKINSVGVKEWNKSFGGSADDKAFSIQQTTDGGYIVAGYTTSNDGDITNKDGGVRGWIVKLTSAGNLQWQKTFGGLGSNQAYSIQQTNDGGYVVAGFSNAVSGNHGGADFWVLKLNNLGNLQWEKSLGGSQNDYATSVEITSEGGFIVAGTTFSNDGDVSGSHGNVDYWVVKLSATGNLQWQKCLGGTLPDYAQSIQQTVDGGYIVAGNSYSIDGDKNGSKGDTDYWIVKLTNSGKLEWQTSLGGSSSDYATSIHATGDGGFIATGKSISNNGDVSGNKGDYDYWVIKLSNTGTIEWQKSMGGDLTDEAYSVVPTADGGYIIAGSSSSKGGDITGNHGYLDYWIVKLAGGPCTPTINISAPSNSSCSGQSVTFKSTPTSEGSSPTYQWKVNNLNVGTSSSTYTSSVLNNNDIVTCELTSNASCANTSKVTSNAIAVTVNATPVVTISGDTCVGSVLTINSSVSPASLVWTLNSNKEVSTQTAGFLPDAITIAGGNGSGSYPNQLNNPNRLFIDALGNVYIPDMSNSRIQKWVPGATAGVTVAGGNGVGSAANQFDRPTSVSMDRQGNLYITDQNNNRIQKWAPGATTGVTFVTGLNYPTGIYIDAYDNMYVSEQNSSWVTKFSAGSTVGITIAGGNGYGAALNQLSTPTGIFGDGAGNIYVCDTDNNRVQKWAPGATSGITVAGGNGYGSGANQLANPLGVFVDSYENIYVSDFNNARVQKWEPGATSGTTITGGNGTGTGANQLNRPCGIWIDMNGDLFISDFYNYRVQKFSNSLSKTFTTLAPGNYTATVTTSNGCIATSNIVTAVAPKTPEVSIISNFKTVCRGVTVTFSATPVNGGSAPLYQWIINGVDAGANNNNASFSSAALNGGDVVGCIITSNANLCLTSKKATSNQITMSNASPEVAYVTIAASDTVICANSAVKFTATATNGGTNPTYQWLVNGGNVATNSSTFTSSSLKDGDVVRCSITSNANLCPDNLSSVSNTIVVQILPQKFASVTIIASDTFVCISSVIQFTASSLNGGTNPVYQWKINGVNTGSNNNIFSTGSLINGDVVSCTMVSDLRCVANSPVTSNNIKVVIDQVPVIVMRSDTIIFSGASVRLSTTVTANSPTYIWSPSATLNNATVASPVAKPTATTTYKLVATSAAGCTAVKQVTITTIESVVIPNVFSPNNDGINDVWNIVGLKSYTDCIVEVYNRYGQLLFQSNGYNKPWDGNYKGSSLPVAAYYYIIKSKILGTKSGSVTILK